MARMTVKLGEEYCLRLSALAAGSETIAKKALFEAADVVADKIRANIERLPEENFRYLHGDDMFNGVPPTQKQDLLDSFGITPMQVDAFGMLSVKIGFDGYGRFPTKTYPKGLPNQLLARSIESGSSWRKKHPFVRPAVTATKKEALAVMERVVDEETEKIMKG